MSLPTDVIFVIDQTFAVEQRQAALTLLQSARLNDGIEPPPRLLRCAAVASHGNLSLLNHYVGKMATDWRDVILAAEYETRNGRSVRIHNLSVPVIHP